MPSIKNRAPAPIQITTGHILRQSHDSSAEIAAKSGGASSRSILNTVKDEDELLLLKQEKRSAFENGVRKERENPTRWIRYALWEESMGEYLRARSVFERGLQHHYKDPKIWLRYAETEMRNKFVNRARNVWDRAVMLLPRVDQLWYKYSYFEEMLSSMELPAKFTVDGWSGGRACKAT